MHGHKGEYQSVPSNSFISCWPWSQPLQHGSVSNPGCCFSVPEWLKQTWLVAHLGSRADCLQAYLSSSGDNRRNRAAGQGSKEHMSIKANTVVQSVTMTRNPTPNLAITKGTCERIFFLKYIAPNSGVWAISQWYYVRKNSDSIILCSAMWFPG